MLYALAVVLEFVAGRWIGNPDEDKARRIADARWYKWVTFAFVPLYVSGFVVACFMWSDPMLSIADKVGLLVTVGLMGGFSINVAHELLHRNTAVERWLAKVTLAPLGYAHFVVEHVRGHHVLVATPEDAVSARYGESYWRFMTRSVPGEFRTALSAERERLARKGRGWWSRDNAILQGWLLAVLLLAVVGAAFGWTIAPWVIAQAMIGIAFLEAINYIEHYGLRRRRLPNGRYERFGHAHSWNSTRLMTGLGIFNLQRHSDHHVHPGRRYQNLELEEGSPELPGGYAQMVMYALIPPLWRRVMHQRIVDMYDGDIRRANLTDELRAKYGYPDGEPVGEVTRPSRARTHAPAGAQRERALERSQS